MHTLPDIPPLFTADAFTKPPASSVFSKQSLNDTLKTIKLALEIDDAHWKQIGGLTEKHWRKIQSGKNPYTADQIIQLCQSLEINIEHLFKGEIDYQTLIQKFKRDSISLPEKYLAPETFCSRVRSTQTLFQYIQFKYGIGQVLRALGRLQIHPQSILIDPKTEISSQINIDLLNEFIADGITQNELIQIGSLNLAAIKCSEIGKQVEKLRSPKEVYQTIFECYHSHLEALTQGRLRKLTHEGCILVLNIPENIQDRFHSSIVGIRASCLVRQGVIKCFLGLLRNSFAECKELSCIYLGDPYCSFEVSWEAAKPHVLSIDDEPDGKNTSHLLRTNSEMLIKSSLHGYPGLGAHIRNRAYA